MKKFDGLTGERLLYRETFIEELLADLWMRVVLVPRQLNTGDENDCFPGGLVTSGVGLFLSMDISPYHPPVRFR